MTTHLAAMISEKGAKLSIEPRPTPKPGLGELLIAVKSVALNPADHIMQEHGLFIPTYPTVIGFDIAGLVLEVGDGVPTASTVEPKDRQRGPIFQVGVTRIAAYAAAIWRSCDPNYGAFQEMCLVPWQHAVPLPESSDLSWNAAATLPVAFQVPLCAWDVMGIPRSVKSNAAFGSGGGHSGPQRPKREALLIWGASSSVGTAGVQCARLLREDPDSAVAAVYATAGAASRDYVRSLGADRVFDHRDADVVERIISQAKSDSVVIRHCFHAIGSLPLCQAVLAAFVSTKEEHYKAKIASAPPPPADMKTVEGVETILIQPTMYSETERLAQFEYWMGTWLRENLARGMVEPSPEPRVVGKGLDTINIGLGMLKSGVSCTKLVVEVAD